MNINLLHKSKFVLVHFLLWVVVYFFFVYFFSYNSNNTSYIIWFSSFLLPITMVTTYFMVYYLIPRYLLTKKYVLFSIYSLYTAIFSTYLIVLAIFGGFIFLSNMEIKKMPPMSRNFVFVLILVYLVVAIFSFISLLNQNFKTISKNKALENKILETQLQIKNQELQYLKKQIHPHFLFNTLNTIYGFALKQSEDTPEIILKLSNLLDYILYQVNKPKVSLKEEIAHIKEYIELEKIRFQDTLKVSFIADEIPESIQISPMLLIPFVENAFKHGNLIDGFLNTEIVIRFSNDNLKFTIKNTTIQNEATKENYGIGLKNIKKRLDILYIDNYTLNISEFEGWYNVNLNVLNLKAN
ncbi:histidine kinase [Aureibaculum sp. A20]|uniref:Histidine kinase n=2 Tax=Aureibaculum flavum TaxID=2795986 RepID=A0ABS0WPY8_9FLAO|nr:histidine kinase [Aureibaculum flavum]